MTGRPEKSEAAEYYRTYIEKVSGDEPLAALSEQNDSYANLLRDVEEADSLHRYAPGKWSIRQVVNHVTDTERAFAFRALSFARGFPYQLPDFDQLVSAAGADADRLPLAVHLEEFASVRLSTLSLFGNLPESAWMRSGVANGASFTVRALAFITAGHAEHHLGILRDRYLA